MNYRREDPVKKYSTYLRSYCSKTPYHIFAAQVSKWRSQCKEAEARLVELTGGKPGDSKTLVWGLGDEERFRGELDETVSFRFKRAFCIFES